MLRAVEPEILDELPPSDSRAVGSRSDLRRLNKIMRHAAILDDAFRANVDLEFIARRQLRVVELGAGDGTLMAALAQRWAKLGVTANVTLVDRQPDVSAQTSNLLRACGWPAEVAALDVCEWGKQYSDSIDVVVVNLFLHHFEVAQLQEMFAAVAAKASVLIACEPRRSLLALLASRLVGLIGCNAVTRHDAVVSVRAGFSGKELSKIWPIRRGWELNEYPAGCFSHCFTARRRG